MTAPRRPEGDLPALLRDLYPAVTPDYRNDVLARTAHTRQRPAWTFLERWIPMLSIPSNRTAVSSTTSRRAWLLLAITMLAVALTTAGLAIVGSRQPVVPRPALSAMALPPTACPPGTPLASGTIATIAGTGVAGASGDGGPATAAMITVGQGLAVDRVGNIYFGDDAGDAVRRIRPDGVIETFASGLTAPSGLAFDAAGNLFVTDDLTTIKMIDPAGMITTVAGTGVLGSTGDGGPAIDAEIGAATLAVGPDESLYFDDANKYRSIDPAGVIHTFAGTGETGFSGDGGPATEATFGNFQYGEVGVAVAQDGSVYLGDGGNVRVRKVDPSGTITTAVGTGTPGHSGDGGAALEATLNASPYGLAIDTTDALYVADWNNANVRRIDAAGIITTAAGSDVRSSAGDCGPANEATLDGPTAVATRDGALFISEGLGNRIRMVVP